MKQKLKTYAKILNLCPPDNIIIQSLGQKIFVGIFSKSLNDIDLQFNSWYNWKATNGDLLWISDDAPNYFAYILSTREHYLEYLFNVLENRFALKTGLELESKTHHKILRHFALKLFRKLKTENFIQRTAPVEIFNVNLDYPRDDEKTYGQIKQESQSLKQKILTSNDNGRFFFDVVCNKFLPITT